MTAHKFLVIFVVLVVTIAGCSESVVIERIKPEPVSAGEAKIVEDISDELAAFEPPFRLNAELFEPEQRPARSAASRSVTANDEKHESTASEPEVRLVGFGSVDAQHALLMIDGRLEALRVGEHYRNVHVLKIAPPRVQLRIANRVCEAKFALDDEGSS